MLRLQEMTILRKKDSKLPINIWIDDTLAYKEESTGKELNFKLIMEISQIQDFNES